MSVNSYSIPDAVSVLIGVLSAGVFYWRYLKNTRDRFSEFLLGSVLLAAAAASLMNFFIDNIVPTGVAASSNPSGAKHATLFFSALYSIGGIVLALMLHFMTRYFRIQNFISENISVVYGVVVIASVFFWTPLCIQAPTHPVSEYSGWSAATPWQPKLTYWGDVFIILWVGSFFYTCRAVWRGPVRHFQPGELRLSRTFVQAAFTAWYGSGFFDMISGLNGLNIIAIIPYSSAAISLCFMGALIFQKSYPKSAAASVGEKSDPRDAFIQSALPEPIRQCVARDVFVCHSSQDLELANAICQDLEGNGFSCWVAPRDIVPGTDYAESIIMGIESCSIVVLLLTVKADESPHVHREIEQAVKKRKRIVTLRIENMQLSRAMDYFLGSTHWLDAGNASPDQKFPEIVMAVEQLLGSMGKASKV